jgi:hypothetical protein
VTTIIVVRRDAHGTFQHFQTTLAQLCGDVELLWDRRTGERRHLEASVPVERRVRERRAVEPEAEPVFLDEPRRIERRQQPESRMSDRRQAERRQHVRDTWRTLGFVLVRRNSPTRCVDEVLD